MIPHLAAAATTSAAATTTTRSAGWFFDLFQPQSVGLTMLTLSVVAAAGLALGGVKIIKGISLGIGGVLFSGLLVGHVLGEGKLSHEVMEFARDFGLILFVYTIGVQVGPGFLASLRKNGLPLNLMAASIVVLGSAITIGISVVFGVPMKDAVGLLSGAVTNTPSLAAAGQALREAKNVPTAQTVAAYAIAYPFGIMGIILTMIVLRQAFGVNLDAEAKEIEREHDRRSTLSAVNLEVSNPNLDGRPIRDVPLIDEGNVVISRILTGDAMALARPETALHRGDVVLAVGPAEDLKQLEVIVGGPAQVDLRKVATPIITRRVLVTHTPVLGRTVEDLRLLERLGVTITRVRRGEVELPPSDAIRLQFGDAVVAVGEPDAVDAAAKELGDSIKKLNHPHVVPIFVGIALGVILGSIPLMLPGVPAPVKLGLAGGPMVMAIILSRLGRFGPLIWYMPHSANQILREVGISIFLAVVGINSGPKFLETLTHGPGLQWLALGAVITAVPLLVVGAFGRAVMKLNFMTLCGVLAGSMTDPPALAFAGTVTQSDAPSVAYATVYPLVMLLRVLIAQLLVLIFA